MDFLNTPDKCFANIKDYPFEPHYIEIEGGMRVHYVDEGPRDATETVLCLHGEPSWSYLYRKMIPVFVEAGYRVIAPDLVGFGKSSKPINKTDYTYQNHVNWMGEILTQLDLKNVTLYCQDWGGMIGLRLVALFGNRFARLCASNTNLTTGYENPKDTEVAMKTFLKWKEFSQKLPFLPIGPILQRSTLRTLDDDEIMAYCMPYPDVEYMAGAMHFPFLVPLDYDHPESAVNRELWDNHLMKWEKPILTLFSDKDRLFFGQEKYIQMLPGAKGQPHTTIEDASHFLQEDKGEEIAHKVIEWMKTT